MGEGKKSSVDYENEALDVTDKKLKYPRSVAFIIGNEFCERFSYYGMKAILVLYFRNVLMYSEDASTEYYHIFAMACYFTPVLGAIIADSLLGKFRTIFYISILYAIGNIVLSFAAYGENSIVTWLGLAAIALGTGGIKPCVAAFGGDQFAPGQESQLQKFFSFFYISINAGSLLSTFLTPILREDVECFGRTDCFPLAFGVPAILMIVALMLFLLGKFLTNYKIIPPSKGNIVVQVCKCVFTALWRKMSCNTPKRDHWLDYADDEYDAKTLDDIKAVMRVLFLYLPLPIFWALFDQQGSRWTLQATRMDGNLFGVYRLKPDQIQVVNPLLIICMIPVFEYGVYPLMSKMNLLKRPLQRITTGGILAAMAFVICAFFQLRIESDLPTELSANSAHITFINGINSTIEFTNPKLSAGQQNLRFQDLKTFENVNIDFWNMNSLKITVKDSVQNCGPNKEYTININETVKEGAILFITESICSETPQIQIYDFPNILTKPEEAGANIALVFNLKNYDILGDSGNGSFYFNNEEFSKELMPLDVNKNLNASTGYMKYTELDVHRGGEYQLSLFKNVSDKPGSQTIVGKNLDLHQGGSYIMAIIGDPELPLSVGFHQVVKPNSVSMFWQIIQYTVITAGEIMFSITGLEFSYSQAPTSMKSVLQAAWLMTVAFGNLIVVIISSAKIFNKQSYEFFFFAGLMVLDMIVFAIMAYFYVPYKSNAVYDDESDKQKNELNGDANKDQQNGFSNGKKGMNNEGFNEENTKF